MKERTSGRLSNHEDEVLLEAGGCNGQQVATLTGWAAVRLWRSARPSRGDETLCTSATPAYSSWPCCRRVSWTACRGDRETCASRLQAPEETPPSEADVLHLVYPDAYSGKRNLLLMPVMSIEHSKYSNYKKKLLLTVTWGTFSYLKKTIVDNCQLSMYLIFQNKNY